MSDNNKTQIGKIGLKQKLVSAKDLDNFLHEQAGESVRFERLASKVPEKGLPDQDKLLKALSEQTGVPAVNINEIQIQLSDLSFLPREIAEQHVVLPFLVDKDSIHLAMANPDNQRVIDELQFVSGKKVFPHVSLNAQITKTIKICYDARVQGEKIYTGPAFGKTSQTSTLSKGLPEINTKAVLCEKAPGTSPLSSNDLTLDIEIDVVLDQLLKPVVPEPRLEPAAELEIQKKILVVDDENDILLLISRVLSEKGYDVVTAGRGLEAIRMVQNENFDLIILDAMLPEVHGFDICRKIKGSKKYGHIPVLMISAIYRGWGYAQDLRDSYGVDEFIEKPFKLTAFLEKVERHLHAGEAAVQVRREDLAPQTERIFADSMQAYRSGKIEKAIGLLEKGLSIDPLASRLRYNLALLLGKKSLNYQAIRELESTLELEPNYYPAMKNLAMLYQKAGFKFKAIEAWGRSLHHCDDDETRKSIKQHLQNLL